MACISPFATAILSGETELATIMMKAMSQWKFWNVFPQNQMHMEHFEICKLKLIPKLSISDTNRSIN